MKKVLFGLAFLGSMMMTGISNNAKADPGSPGGDKWVCCQVNYESYCTDMLGNGWNSDVKKFQEFC